MRRSSPNPCFLAEWYRQELSDNAIDEFFALLATTTEEVSTDAAPVWLMATLFVPSDDVIYGVFSASSSAVVVQACTRAGMVPERLIPDVSLLRPERRKGGTPRNASTEHDQVLLFRVSNRENRC